MDYHHSKCDSFKIIITYLCSQKWTSSLNKTFLWKLDSVPISFREHSPNMRRTTIKWMGTATIAARDGGWIHSGLQLPTCLGDYVDRILDAEISLYIIKWQIKLSMNQVTAVKTTNSEKYIVSLKITRFKKTVITIILIRYAITCPQKMSKRECYQCSLNCWLSKFIKYLTK